MARDPEAVKRAAFNYFQRNRNNPAFLEKRRGWVREYRRTHPEMMTTLRHRFNILKAKCKHRSLEIAIDFEQYSVLLHGQECHYCGSDLSRSKGSSLDRLDSSKGYIPGNCVPCCYHCNVMKSDLSVLAFYAKLEAILRHRDAKQSAK